MVRCESERVVTEYFDVIGFDFHGFGEIGPSRNVADFLCLWNAMGFMELLIRTNSGDAVWIYNAVKPNIAAKATFIVGVVKSNPLKSPPFANGLKAVNAKVVFSHICIAHMNDPGVPIEVVTPVVPDVPGNLSAFVIRNVVGVQSVNHLTFSPCGRVH